MVKVELLRAAKYHCADLTAIRERLRRMQACYVITKQQTDYIYRIYDEATRTSAKRVKIRIEDEQECSLFIYVRSDQERDIAYEYYANVDRQLIPIFNAIYGEAVRIHKEREVWRLDEFEYHLDTVDGIGTIFEIENLLPEQSRAIEPGYDNLAYFRDVLLTKIEGSNEDLIGGVRDSELEA
jgi:adenylate cyclase class IV